MESYRTVRRESAPEMIEKKSRFIGHVRPVGTEEEALAFINEIRSRHRTATHNVYAYVLRERNLMRCSDDGEPAGTAGMPVLEVIRKEGLLDVAVVVTRYFGGILLGSGGLVRAYARAAKLGIDEAQIITKALCGIYSVSTDYSLLGTLRHEMDSKGHKVTDCAYGENVTLTVCVRAEDCERFESDVADISSGRARAIKIDERYVEI